MIKLTKEIQQVIDNNPYYSAENFEKDVKTYIKALKANRALFTVTHVSKSGMTRYINVKSFEGKMSKGYFRNYINMFKVLGYEYNRDYDSFKIGGCGMNMVFALNYYACMKLKDIGAITKKTFDTVSQLIN